MDRRKLLWLGGLMMVAALGCRRAEKSPTVADPYASATPPPAAGELPSATAQSPYHAVSRSSRKEEPAKEPEGKPSNLVKIANVYTESAINETNPTEQRQQAMKLALQHYRRALQLDPKLADGYLGLARLHGGFGQEEQAIQALDAGIAKLPKEPRLWHVRGMHLGRLKKYPEAIKSLHQAAQLEPANAQYSKSVGLMLARAGHGEEAIPWLRRSMNEADARYNVARLMRHIGNEEEARKNLARALQADPGHEGALAMQNEDKAPVEPDSSLRVASYAAEQQPQQPLPPLRIIVDSQASTAPATPTAPAPPAAPAMQAPAPATSTAPVVQAPAPVEPQPPATLPQRPAELQPRPSPVMPIVSEQWEQQPTTPAPTNNKPSAQPTAPRSRPKVKLGFEPNG